MNDNTEKYKHIILPIIAEHAPNAKVILYGFVHARTHVKDPILILP